MKMGSVCVKTAGRDAGKVCIIVDEVDGMVLIDGLTRRRKCSLRHLEWLGRNADIKKGVGHEDVLRALAGLGVKIADKGRKKVRERKSEKPKRKHSKREKREGRKK